MTDTELRREITRRLGRLDKSRLRSAADYVKYLDEYSDPVAVSMARRLQQAEGEVASGMVTPVHALRRKR